MMSHSFLVIITVLTFNLSFVLAQYDYENENENFSNNNNRQPGNGNNQNQNQNQENAEDAEDDVTTARPATTTTRRPVNQTTIDPVHVQGQVNQILSNVDTLNITGIVDQSLGIRNNVPVRNLVNGILSSVFCNPFFANINNCGRGKSVEWKSPVSKSYSPTAGNLVLMLNP